MDKESLGRVDAPPFTPESVAANIRRYVHAHRSGSSTAISVVANLATGVLGQVQVEPASHGHAVDALRGNRGQNRS